MNHASSLSNGVLSAAELRRVDDICVRFEDLWRKGQRPRLEASLRGAHGPERQELLRELLRLERHYRQALNEPLDGRKYEGRLSWPTWSAKSTPSSCSPNWRRWPTNGWSVWATATCMSRRATAPWAGRTRGRSTPWS